MTKYEADIILGERFKKLNELAGTAEGSTEEYVRLTDALLAVYVTMTQADSFEDSIPFADKGHKLN